MPQTTMSQPNNNDDGDQIVDSSPGHTNHIISQNNEINPPSVAASMSSSSLMMMLMSHQNDTPPTQLQNGSNNTATQFGNNFIDVGDYDWMGVLDQTIFNDIGSDTQGDDGSGGCDDNNSPPPRTFCDSRQKVAIDAGCGEAVDDAGEDNHDGIIDNNTASKVAVTSFTATTAVENQSRVEKKRSREKQRRLDTNSQLAALTDLVQDIDATDLAEEEAMAVAYNYARKARQWNNKGGQAETNNDNMIQGEEGGGGQQQQQQHHCGRDENMFDEDSAMMIMMNTMMESRHVVEGMMGVKGSPAGGFSIPPNLANLISQSNTVEGNAAKKFKSPSSTTLITSAAASSTAAAATASNNRIDLFARTIVQLKKLRQLRRVRIDELRAARSQHCELRKECDELRKTVAHYKAMGMPGGCGGGPCGGAKGIAMGVSCGGYNGGGYHYQQEKVMMMVPMMVSPHDAMYHQGPNCVPVAAAAHPYHQAVPATSRPYYSSMLNAAPPIVYLHQQPTSIDGMEGGGGGEGLPQGTACEEDLEQAHQSQAPPRTGTTMIATVGGIGSVHQHSPPQGGNTLVHYPPHLQQPMMTMCPTNQVGIPVSTMPFEYNYPQQQQQQQQSMYQIVSQHTPTYVAGHSIAPHTATVHYQNLGLETAVATGNPQQQHHTIDSIDPTANNNSVSHVNLDQDNSDITSVQSQQHHDGVGGGNIDQLSIISSDKHSTSATSMNQAGGGGNLAHCA